MLLFDTYIIHQKRYFPCQRDHESSLTVKAQDKQNISETFEIIFFQKPADKEKIEVTISLITYGCFERNNKAVNIVPAKGIGSTGITFYLGCPVDVNKMALEKNKISYSAAEMESLLQV